MRRPGLALSCLMLAACQPAAVSNDMAAETGGGLPASGLERAAIESGVITDAAKISPVGLFPRRPGAGRDA